MANTEKIVVQVVVQGEKDLQKLEKRTGTTTKGFGRMTAGILGAVVAFRQITKIVSQSIRTFRDFEFQMAKVRAVSGASNAEFKKLTSTAQELGRTTFFTATQVGELQTNFAKLGFTTTEILNAQEATLDLATATGSDLARSAIVAGSAIRGFGLDARETQRVVDVMAVAFTSSALDIEKFQTSMTKVAPIASAAGISIESTSAVMGTLTDAGIEASIAGTSLRNIFLKMQDPASDLSKHLGFTVKGTDDLEKALKQLNSEGLSNADMMQLVDLRQVAAFQTMVNGADNILDLTNALENSNGAGREMAEMVGQTLEGSFLRLKSAAEGLQIALVEGFVGQALTKIVNVGADVLNFLTDFTKGIESVNSEIANAATVYKGQEVALTNMAGRFDELSSNTNKTAEEEKELQRILITLQGEFGRSVVSVDNKTKALILNRSALDAVIARTALLADTEALKLVHKLTKVDQEIKLEKEKKGVIDETIKSITSSTSAMAENIASEAAQQDQVSQNIVVYDEFGNAVDRLKQNTNNLRESEDESAASAIKLKALEEDRLLLKQQLTDAGYSQEEVERLLNQTIEQGTELVSANTDKIKDENTAKRTSLDLDREILDFQLNEMIEGNLNEEQMADVRKKLIQQEINDLKKLLNQLVFTNEEREKMMKNMHELEMDLAEENSKDKDKRLEEDIVRAALSGQNAEEAVKSVIRAHVMEAVAIQIKEIIKKVPFPLNLILAAGAGIVVGRLVDKALDSIPEFERGGMIQEYANGGMVHGRSHAQGGEKFAVGGRVVELEGGEAVINKRSTSMFRNQLSAMNAAGGGVKFADGGMLNQPQFSQQQFNAIGQNQMMGAMSSGSKVVVVEADITDSQNSVSVIQSDARI